MTTAIVVKQQQQQREEAMLMDRIRRKIAATQTEDPFYIVDLETLCERFNHWNAHLPVIKPFYAVKCNPNPAVLHILEKLGMGFDCASREEIDRVMDMGVDASRLIFANPCKLQSHILHAKLRNVRRMTFDNADELLKVAKVYPDAEMVLRIITDDSQSLCQFSSKFGAPLCSVRELLELAAELKVNIVGVSFHVGSGCADPAAFGAAARDALKVFEWAREYGFDLKLLDVGGGFQGTDDAAPTLPQIAQHLLPELEKFPAGTQFIAEPGRYFATKSHTLCVYIHSRRVIRDPATGEPVKVIYYINDGVYHSFNCIMFDHQHPVPMTIPTDESLTPAARISSTVFGPTCDSLDMIVKDYPLPLLEVGDWLYFPNMGAYTTAAMTRFNGFPGAITYHYCWGDRFMENVLGAELDTCLDAWEKQASAAAFADEQRLPVLTQTVQPISC